MPKNCKCKKKPVVVAMRWDEDPKEFMTNLSDQLRLVRSFYFVKCYPEIDDWIENLRTKLKCICKKHGRKPDLVSTLFDSSLDLQLSKVQCLCDGVFVSGSSNKLFDQAFIKYQPLIISHPGESVEYADNTRYVLENGYEKIFRSSEKNAEYRDVVLGLTASRGAKIFHYDDIVALEADVEKKSTQEPVTNFCVDINETGIDSIRTWSIINPILTDDVLRTLLRSSQVLQVRLRPIKVLGTKQAVTGTPIDIEFIDKTRTPARLADTNFQTVDQFATQAGTSIKNDALVIASGAVAAGSYNKWVNQNFGMIAALNWKKY